MLEVIWTIKKKELKERKEGEGNGGSGWKLSRRSMNDHILADGQNHGRNSPSILFTSVQRIILFRPDDTFLFVSVNKAPRERRDKARFPPFPRNSFPLRCYVSCLIINEMIMNRKRWRASFKGDLWRNDLNPFLSFPSPFQNFYNLIRFWRSDTLRRR